MANYIIFVDKTDEKALAARKDNSLYSVQSI